MKDFLVPVILKAIEDEEDALLARKAQQRLVRIEPENCISIEDAFKEAGWDA
jgi:hypothetical protein